MFITKQVIFNFIIGGHHARLPNDKAAGLGMDPGLDPGMKQLQQFQHQQQNELFNPAAAAFDQQNYTPEQRVAAAQMAAAAEMAARVHNAQQFQMQQQQSPPTGPMPPRPRPEGGQDSGPGQGYLGEDPGQTSGQQRGVRFSVIIFIEPDRWWYYE